MKEGLVETAQEIFLGLDGVNSVDIHVEEILCVEVGMKNRSRDQEFAVYDAELVLREKFPDTYIRVHLTRD